MAGFHSQASRERERKGVCTFSVSMKILHVVISSLMHNYKITMADNTEELHRRIKELEKEVAYLNDQLKQDDRFGLKWIDVPEAFDKESENKIPILEEVPELAITNDDGKPTHIIIEGDNYHALTCLNYTHHGKVDVIYIDPPYNTGSDGFTYKDKRFLDKYPDGAKLPANHPLRHSSWLSFMDKRLKLAKELLKDDGIIFISIGDDELAHLIMLCDKMYDRIAIVPRVAKKGSDQGTFFRPTKDYILVYAKNRSLVKGFQGVDMPEPKKYPYKEGKRDYRKGHSLFQASLDSMRGCKNQRYYIEAPDGTLIIPPGNIFPKDKIDGGKIAPETKIDNVWRWSQQAYLNKKHLVMFDKSKRSPLVDSFGNHTDWNVYEKKYMDEELTNEVNPLPDDIVYDYINSLGTTRLSQLDIDFAFSKPYELIKYLLQITDKRKDAVILDFFSGSGTTMESVMSLNEDDGGNREAILCQDAFENVCRELTYERNKRIIRGYTNSKGYKNIPLGNSLKYYRTSFVGSNTSNQATDKDKTLLAQKAGCLLALAENTLYEQKKTDNYQIFKDKDREVWTAIYFKEDYRHKFFSPFVEEVSKPNGKKNVYIFSWGDVGSFESYFDGISGIDIKGIPQPILDIYKSLNS